MCADSPEPPPGPTPDGPPNPRAEDALAHGGHRGARRKVIVGVVAGSVLIVLLLLIAGVFPGWLGSSEANGISYATAAPLARAGVPATFAANPILLAAVGLDSLAAGEVNLSSFANATANCAVNELPGYPAGGVLALPTFRGRLDSGLAPLWIFAFEAATGGPYLVVSVEDGSARALLNASGTGCGTLLSGVKPLPSKVVDSPAAASAAWAAGGSTYVRTTANATTLSMIAEGGNSTGLFTSPLWVFVYAPCSPLAGGTVAHVAYVVTLSLSTAGSAFPPFTITTHCPG